MTEGEGVKKCPELCDVIHEWSLANLLTVAVGIVGGKVSVNETSC